MCIDDPVFDTDIVGSSGFRLLSAFLCALTDVEQTGIRKASAVCLPNASKMTAVLSSPSSVCSYDVVVFFYSVILTDVVQQQCDCLVKKLRNHETAICRRTRNFMLDSPDNAIAFDTDCRTSGVVHQMFGLISLLYRSRSRLPVVRTIRANQVKFANSLEDGTVSIFSLASLFLEGNKVSYCPRKCGVVVHFRPLHPKTHCKAQLWGAHSALTVSLVDPTVPTDTAPKVNKFIDAIFSSTPFPSMETLPVDLSNHI
ncbi:hypothetical protein CRM22_000437 [Opisthorchis felineus]|uniref:Uncharacterized protein n=1 Tax=Opisthorchis felineus TaxID=147828 RepID=A0A4S2MF21_OPIFE|nr:hypothetical protein CRM22_000437 [Opisthorchis felineus]